MSSFFLIEYSSNWLIPEVAVNYRVVQNRRTPGSSFKFVVQQLILILVLILIFSKIQVLTNMHKYDKPQGQYWIEYLYSTNNSNYQYGRC